MLIGVAACSLYVVACLCLGTFLVRRLLAADDPLDRPSASATLATGFLLGQGVLANLWQLVSLARAFSMPVVAVTLGFCILVGFRTTWTCLRRLTRESGPGLAAYWKEPLSWRLATCLILAACLAAGVSVLVPLSGWSDAAAFYLPIAKVMAASHRLVPLPGYEAFTTIGLQGEFHYAALMSLGSGQWAKLFVWPTSLAAAMMLLAIGSVLGLRQRGKWIALAMLCTSTAFTFLIGDGKVDLFGAAMGVAFFYWGLRIKVGSVRSSACLAGLFAGFAVVAKVSYLVSFAPGAFLLVAWRGVMMSSGRLRTRVMILARVGVAFGFWFGLSLLPHILKNALLFGEPLAPFIGSTGQFWANQVWFSSESTLKLLLTYPLALILGGYPGQFGDLSILFLAFAPLVVLMPRPASFARNGLVQLTLASVFGVVLWMISRPSVFALRYFLAPLLALIPVVACFAEHAIQKEERPRWLGAGVLLWLVIVCAGMVYLELPTAKKAAQYLSGRASECTLVAAGTSLALGSSVCEALTVVNNDAAPGDRVCLSTYYRFWLRPDLLQCIWRPSDASNPCPDGAQPEGGDWSRLFKLGFRYLVIDKVTFKSIAALYDPLTAPSWLDVTTLFNDAGYAVFRLESKDPSRRPCITCQQVAPPAWDLVKQ